MFVLIPAVSIEEIDCLPRSGRSRHHCGSMRLQAIMAYVIIQDLYACELVRLALRND